MAQYLTFHLIGPMGAFGGPAGHEYRRTQNFPTRSAVLGLVGAALGVRRDDDQGQLALADIGVAVALYTVGQGFRDFHTVQSVTSNSIKSPSTRAAAMLHPDADINTSLTQRDYLTDCAYSVALWIRGSDTPPLSTIAQALKKPFFCLFLGRKSCPISHPTGAVIVDVDKVQTALTQHEMPSGLNLPSLPSQITSDHLDTYDREDWFMDDPHDRGLWHFRRRRAFTSFVKGEQ